MKNPGMMWILKQMDKSVLRYFHPCPYEVSRTTMRLIVIVCKLFFGQIKGFLNISGVQIKLMLPSLPFGVYQNRFRFYDEFDSNAFSVTTIARNKAKLT
jgi:hypothetical protein